MDTDIAIGFNHVSKRFKKGRKLLLKEALLDAFKPLRSEDFWVLKDVDFHIKKGETVGIIGTNGSGKSTILKLIAKVMFPDKGTISTIGNIAPLIELGAGFHFELSGRENIYLNGVILGLKRTEIDKKFNSIVRFAELEDFIDTPIKHYSSGMYMRLGFSIAVHTEPDILLVDEILAVGDESFQKKCFKKMKEIQKTGKTIVFVSHSLKLIREFCDRAILIRKGTVYMIDKPSEVIATYRKLMTKE